MKNIFKMVNKKKVVFKYENKLSMKKKNICDLYIYNFLKKGM